MNRDEFRWDPYCVVKGGEAEAFWRARLGASDASVLYILGKGFDRRMCAGVEMMKRCGPLAPVQCLLIDFDEGEESPSHEYRELIDSNLRTLFSVVGEEAVESRGVQMWADDEGRRRRVGPSNAANVFQEASLLADFEDVVLDISALPRGLYLPLLGSLLSLMPPERNLHVIAAENPEVDRLITEAGLDEEAHYLPGFKGSLALEATAEWPRIWIPILGEGQAGQLERIHSLVDPIEICPVLPWPANRIRRPDNLVAEYHALLFDTWRVDPRNFIYASEDNPFHAYKAISRTVRHYDHALRPLGGCKVAISALSSKLLSVGAFLAAYELMQHDYAVGLPHVESQGYEYPSFDVPVETELVSLWIAGECYAA